MPNHRISSGENAVTGMYRIAEITGEIISFRLLQEQISKASGIAIAIDKNVAVDIRLNEYRSPVHN